MSDDYTSPEALERLLQQPQSYGNGYECCKQQIALAQELRKTREELKEACNHALVVQEQIVGSFRTLAVNNKQIASLTECAQKIQAEARGKAFEEACFAVSKLSFVPEGTET